MSQFPYYCENSTIRTSLHVHKAKDALCTPARTRALLVPKLCSWNTSDRIVDDIKYSVDSHKEIDSMEEIPSHIARRVSQQTEKQEADGNLGEGAADQEGHFQSKVPFSHMDLLWRCQMNDVLTETFGYLQAIEAEGDHTADLLKHSSNERTNQQAQCWGKDIYIHTIASRLVRSSTPNPRTILRRTYSRRDTKMRAAAVVIVTQAMNPGARLLSSFCEDVNVADEAIISKWFWGTSRL